MLREGPLSAKYASLIRCCISDRIPVGTPLRGRTITAQVAAKRLRVTMAVSKCLRIRSELGIIAAHAPKRQPAREKVKGTLKRTERAGWFHFLGPRRQFPFYRDGQELLIKTLPFCLPAMRPQIQSMPYRNGCVKSAGAALRRG